MSVMVFLSILAFRTVFILSLSFRFTYRDGGHFNCRDEGCFSCIVGSFVCIGGVLGLESTSNISS
ncbi:unnamed protein product [Prunus brigantina]